MSVISVQNAVKAFESDKNILDGAYLDVAAGRRIGLVGKNGAGKTTLFRAICGEIALDEGTVAIAAGAKLGLVTQLPKYPAGWLCEDVLIDAQRPVLDLRDEMEALERRLASGSDDALLKKYDALSAEFSRLGGYTLETERNRVANGLDISAKMRSSEYSTLSGGEQTRVNLARLLLGQADVLLLDEPTNHLDAKAALWLEEYLKRFKGTVVVISHDRYFLDSVATDIVELENGKTVSYGGNYSFFTREKRRREEEQQRRFEREQAEISRLQATADRMKQYGTEHAVRKSKIIESRIARIATAEEVRHDASMRTAFRERDFKGDEVFSVKDCTKSFDGKPLFMDVELTVRGGERIALLGDNGTGKTTFLRCLLGEEKPDGGRIKLGPSVKAAYLPQKVTFPNDRETVLDTVIAETRCTPQSARNRLGSFLFSGEDVFKQVRTLSGGEKSRLRLCILMNADINLLILDEPTNHLDLPSREWIEGAVEGFEGTLLFVSHDRYFINKFATRIWHLENARITDYLFGYEKYLAARTALQASPKKDIREPRAEKKPEKPKGLSPLKAQSRIEKLEREIAAVEEQIADARQLMSEAASDYAKLLELEKTIAELQALADEKYGQIEELEDFI
ncbi:MAG: ABC-F family ATP-binding cassette domain-containing protein [Oscillospiraceae bacterium]|jgi:ATPase subunit of ABC transporter with duplicated ATPase domains|nr:ABC-F family ATP-binding cassette domain-containing protein [Oscillospiraceae bacterium]